MLISTPNPFRLIDVMVASLRLRREIYVGMRDRTRLFSSCFCLLTSTNSENDIVDVAKAIAIFPIVALFKSNSGRVDATLRAVRVVLEGEIVTYVGS